MMNRPRARGWGPRNAPPAARSRGFVTLSPDRLYSRAPTFAARLRAPALPPGAPDGPLHRCGFLRARFAAPGGGDPDTRPRPRLGRGALPAAHRGGVREGLLPEGRDPRGRRNGAPRRDAAGEVRLRGRVGHGVRARDAG